MSPQRQAVGTPSASPSINLFVTRHSSANATRKAGRNDAFAPWNGGAVAVSISRGAS